MDEKNQSAEDKTFEAANSLLDLYISFIKFCKYIICTNK